MLVDFIPDAGSADFCLLENKEGALSNVEGVACFGDAGAEGVGFGGHEDHSWLIYPLQVEGMWLGIEAGTEFA